MCVKVYIHTGARLRFAFDQRPLHADIVGSLLYGMQSCNVDPAAVVRKRRRPWRQQRICIK